MGLEDIAVWIVEDFDGGILDGAVHALSLTISPGVVRLGRPVLDAVFLADTVEDMRSEIYPCRSLPVLRQIGESHAIVGEHGVDAIGKSRDDLSQEGGSVHLGVGIAEGDVSELGHAVDGEEHEQLAFGQAQLADIDVDVTDPGLGEAFALGGSLVVLRQA